MVDLFLPIHLSAHHRDRNPVSAYSTPPVMTQQPAEEKVLFRHGDVFYDHHPSKDTVSHLHLTAIEIDNGV